MASSYSREHATISEEGLKRACVSALPSFVGSKDVMQIFVIDVNPIVGTAMSRGFIDSCVYIRFSVLVPGFIWYFLAKAYKCITARK